MTQPGGDHASGVKLASAYVDVRAHTSDGGKDVHQMLTGVEEHATQVGTRSADSIATAITNAGEPAARGFLGRLSTFAQGPSRGIGNNVGQAMVNGVIDGFRESRLVDNADFLFNGFKEKSALEGAAAAQSFHGRFIQLIAANRIDAANEAQKTGEALSQGIRTGALEAGEGFGLGEAFEKASQGLGRLGGKFGEAGEAAGGLGEKLGGLAAPLAMFADPAVLGVGAVLGLAGGLAEVVHRVDELGEHWEALGHRLEIQTGATGEQLEALKAQVGGVYGQVTNSMDEVGSIVSVVNTSFRDTGDGAATVATQLEHLQSMVGAVDTVELGNAFRAFNIGGNAPAQGSVIDQLLKESQATQVPINMLIESMQRAAPIANQFHLSIGDTLATMGEFSQAGIDPSRTIFALSRAAGVATKQGRDFKSVLQEDIDAIKNAKDEQAAEAAATAAFGPTSGRGGAAMIVQAVRSGNFNLDPAFLAQIEHADGLVNKTFHDTMTWKESFTLFGHDVSVALQPISEALHAKVQGAMQAVVNFLTEHKGQIVGFATGVVNAVEKGVQGVGKVVDYLRPAFEQIKPQIEDVVKAFVPMEQSIARDILPVVEALGKALLVTLKVVIENSGPTLEFFADIFKDIKGVADYLHDHFGPALKENSKELHDDFEGVKNIVHDVGVVFHDVFNPILDTIKSIVHALDSGMDTLNRWKDALNNIHMPHISLPHIPGFAFGGVVHAQDGLALPGYGGGDIIPALLEPGEHVITKEEVKAGGGHTNIALIRALIRAGVMPDILGQMTGLGVAAVGAGYQTGGPVGYAAPGTPGAYSQALTRLSNVTDHLANTFTKARKGIEGLTESVDTIKKGDLGGTIDKLGQVVDDLRPAAKDLKSGVEAMTGVSPAAPSLPRVGLPSLRGRDYLGAFDRTREAAERLDKITSDTGIYEDQIPGLQHIQHLGDLFHHGADIREHLHGRNVGGAAGSIGAAADTIDKLGNATGFDLSHITGPISEVAQTAGTAAFTVEGLGAALGALLPEAGAAVGAAAGPIGLLAGGYALYRPGGPVDRWATGEAQRQTIADFGRDAMTNVLSPQRQQQIKQQQAAPQTLEDIPNPLTGPKPTPGYTQTPGSLSPFAGAGTAGVPGMDAIIAGAAKGGTSNPLFSLDVPGSQWGGPITGPGPKGIDSRLIVAAPGEHMLPADEVDKAGGHSGIYLLRALIRAGLLQGMAGGGPVDSFVDSMQGTPYSQGARNDCSGMASQIANVALGLPPRSSMFTTRNEGEWLAAHGFKMGVGPPGTLRIGWYNHGSDPNDGHTAVTLPDGRPAEAGGSHGNFIAGAGAAGADAAEFDHHAYLPMNPEGPAVGGTGSGATSPAAAVSGGGGGGGASGGTSGGGNDFASSLGDIISGGLKENLPPGFSDPTEWGTVKSAAAFMKFLATATGKPGSALGMLAAARGTQGAGALNLFGDLLGGSGGAAAQDITSLITGGDNGLAGIVAPPPSDATGAPIPGQGGTTVINKNTTYTGDITDMAAHNQAKDAAAQRDLNKTLKTQRLVTNG